MKKIIVFIILFISCLYLYGTYIEPKRFNIREYNVSSSYIPKDFDGYKIIHISDLYYDGDDIDDIIDKINRVNSDLIVFTGDLLRNNISKKNQDKLIDYFNKIESRYGIYFVKGDNDNNKKYDYVISNIDVTILNNEYKFIYNNSNVPIILYGIDNNADVDSLFNTEYDSYYKIVLSHFPDNYDIVSDKNVNLFLAGHSLNGQIRIPFVGALIKNNGSKKYFDSVYNINNTNIYISNGISDNNYKFRLFNTPSINFYRLYNT